MIQTVVYLVLVAVGGLGVVLTRNPTHQTMVLSLYGTLLGILFLTLKAPDVTLAELTIGAAALPLMMLVTLANTQARTKPRAGYQKLKHEVEEGDHE